MSIVYSNQQYPERGYTRFTCATPGCEVQFDVSDSHPKPLPRGDQICVHCQNNRRRALTTKVRETKKARGTNFQVFNLSVRGWYHIRIPAWLEYVTPCTAHEDCKNKKAFVDVAWSGGTFRYPNLAIACARKQREASTLFSTDYQKVYVRDKRVFTQRRERVMLVATDSGWVGDHISLETLKAMAGDLYGQKQTSRFSLAPEGRLDLARSA